MFHTFKVIFALFLPQNVKTKVLTAQKYLLLECLPASPPSLKGVPYQTSKGTRKNRIAGTEEPKVKQDKISGTTTAHMGAGE